MSVAGGSFIINTNAVAAVVNTTIYTDTDAGTGTVGVIVCIMTIVGRKMIVVAVVVVPALDPISTIQKAPPRAGTSCIIFTPCINNGTDVDGAWIYPSSGGLVPLGEAIDFEGLE